MPDILTMKFNKNKKVKVRTFICENCELEFLVYADLPSPQFCPYCLSSNINENDSCEIYLEEKDRH